jgi:hypothetical protein
MRYRFRRTTQRVTYQFRAAFRPDHPGPYVRGASRPRRVMVLP